MIDISLAPPISMIAPYTMMPVARLWALALLLARCGQQGAMAQCGVWNGGSAALLAHALPATEVWLFDSFAGMAVPGPKDGAKALDKHERASANWCRGDQAKVREVFQKIGWKEERLHIVPGWFTDTLGDVDTGPLTLLHIDADFYESTLLPLQRFFPDLVPGGLLIVDDYGHWPGARAACDEYLEGAKGYPLRPRDPTRWWRVGEERHE